MGSVTGPTADRPQYRVGFTAKAIRLGVGITGLTGVFFIIGGATGLFGSLPGIGAITSMSAGGAVTAGVVIFIVTDVALILKRGHSIGFKKITHTPTLPARPLTLSDEQQEALVDSVNEEKMREAKNTGRSPLHNSVADGDIVRVGNIYKQNPEAAKCPDVNGDLPLHTAARLDNLGILKYLLEQEPVIWDSNYNHDTPLHVAIKNGKSENAVTIIGSISESIDFEAKDQNGNTALILAILKGYDDVVEALLDAGAKVDTMDGNGKSPLEIAEEINNTNAVALLKKKS